MAKFYGKVGFITYERTGHGITSEVIHEKEYYGEMLRDIRRYESGDKINDNITINGELSILSDVFATQNIANIRYVTYLGTRWKVSSVEVRYPRLVLTLGGVYNVQQN